MKKLIVLLVLLGVLTVGSTTQAGSLTDRDLSGRDLQIVIINDTDITMHHALNWLNGPLGPSYIMGAELGPGKSQKVTWKNVKVMKRLYRIHWGSAKYYRHDLKKYKNVFHILTTLDTIKVIIYHKYFKLIKGIKRITEGGP